MIRAIIGALIGLMMTGCSHSAGGVDIWDAVEQNDGFAIRKFKTAGGDVNVLGWDGSTPLWTALEHKKRYSYEALLDCGADPNVIMRGKRVVTHWAAMEEDPWWLRLALEHGAKPNLVNIGYGRPMEGPPLEAAISKGTIESVKLLLEYGAHINKPFSDGPHPSYPLAVAAQSTKFDIVLYLLEQGADYEKAESALGESFLEHFRKQYENRDEWYNLRDDRTKIDEIYAYLKAKGVKFGEG